MASRFLTPFGNRGLFSGDPFVDLQREMNRLFDRSFRDLSESGEGSFMLSPRVDITQKDDGWEVTAELPGVDQKDIDLRLDGDVLTICGEKRDERKDDKNRLVERSYGSFSRSFTSSQRAALRSACSIFSSSAATLRTPRTRRPYATFS